MIDIGNIVGEVSTVFKQGSTRTVYFPINKKKIILDGIETEVETILKVVKPHSFLEKDSDSPEFGKKQNKLEIKLSKTKYSKFIKNQDGSFISNKNGILCPIINYDDNNNWIEMIRLTSNPMTIPIFNRFSAAEKFPAGLFFDDVISCVKQYFLKFLADDVEFPPDYISTEKMELLITHPFIETYISLMKEFNIIPMEFNHKNLGLILYPTESIAICDYGIDVEYNNLIYDKKMLDNNVSDIV